MPDLSGSGAGSPERIALDLLKFLVLKGVGPAPQTVENYLDLYGQCLHATQGKRPLVGRKDAFEPD